MNKKANEHADRVCRWIETEYKVPTRRLPSSNQYYPCDVVTVNQDGSIRDFVEVKDRRFIASTGRPQNHNLYDDYVIPYGKVATLRSWCQPLRNSVKFVYEYYDAWAVWTMPFDLAIVPPLKVGIFERTDRGWKSDVKPHLFVPRSLWRIIEKPKALRGEGKDAKHRSS